MYLTDVSARGVSARQLNLKLDVSYRTALHMTRRIRADRMRDNPISGAKRWIAPRMLRGGGSAAF
jgi:hypothetical protein